jgi:hypothetical protein
MQLKLTDNLVDDPDFSPLFIQDGYAVLLQARLVCAPGNIQFEFDPEFMETDQTLADQGLEHANGYFCRGGDSRYFQCSETVIVEAVTAVGPFRASLLHYESLDRVHQGLSDLLGHIRKQLDEAAASPNAIVGRNEVDLCTGHMGSADVLLAELFDAWERRKNDPEIARFLVMPIPNDGPTLH